MDRYKILCTEEQTKKAIKLGAPIKIADTRDKYSFLPQYSDSTGCRTKKFEDAYKNCYCDETAAYLIPTAEQMIGWLEEQESIISIEVIKCDGYWQGYVETTNYKDAIGRHGYSSRKGATIAVIDAALEYLTKNKN